MHVRFDVMFVQSYNTATFNIDEHCILEEYQCWEIWKWISKIATVFVFLKSKKKRESAFFFSFSSPLHDGMLHSAEIRHYTKQQKNLEFEDKEVWRGSEEDDEANEELKAW